MRIADYITQPHGSGTATGQGESMKASKKQSKPQARGRRLDSVVGRFSFAEFLGSFYVRDPMGGVIALCSKKIYAEEIVDALNAMRDSKEKCRRNRDNWKKRAEAAEAKLDWLMVQGIRGIAPGWVGIPEVEWDSTYPPNTDWNP